jgi:hypothetical protein
MKSIQRIALFGIFVALSASGPSAIAGSHTWEVWEVFSNADGSVQFVEIKETHGGTAEVGLGGHTMIGHPSGISTGMANVTGNTAFTFYLLATHDFAALPGAPTPDITLPAGVKLFQNATDTSMEYSFTNTASWTLGTLPTDGIHSLTRTVSLGPLSVATNSPTNFAGVPGSVDASGGASLPGVPDGLTGTAMKVGKLAADGSSLSITWDTGTCSDANNHQILYGQKTGFPAVPGGTYTLQGGTCGIGSTSPFTWTPTPSAVDGNGLTWFLVVTKNASGVEGPWGTYNGVAERNGPGTGGSSNVCTTTTKSIAGTCGH